jgi:hypothetical protein
MGVAWICRGVAPAVIERIVGGEVPRMATIINGSATVAIGALFVLLHFAVRRGRRWAMWTACCVATLMFGFSLPVLAGPTTPVGGVFLALLAACTGLTNMLGLKVDSLERAEAHERIVEDQRARRKAARVGARAGRRPIFADGPSSGVVAAGANSSAFQSLVPAQTPATDVRPAAAEGASR